MKNKGIILISIVVVILVGTGFVFYLNSKNSLNISMTNNYLTPTVGDQVNDTLTANSNVDNESLREKLLTNIVLTVPETKETINFSGEEGKWSEGYVMIGENFASLSNGAVVTTLDVNRGGNSRDVYLAVFEPGENAWHMTNAMMLGEPSSNAEIKELSTDMDFINIVFMTFEEDMSSQADQKTIENKKVFIYSGGKLSETTVTP